MEDEKKKKKNNKKKKNKQQHQVKSVVEENINNIEEEETSGLSLHNAEHESTNNNTNAALLADNEKQIWLQEEARLRDMVKQLLYEKDKYVQNQADLEMKIEQLQGENDSWHQKERDLQENIIHIEKERALLVEKENSNKEMIAELNNEIDTLQMQALSADTEKQIWLQEEARLRDMVKQLLYEKDTYVQNQADLEMKIEQLQGENDSWHQKEIIMEQRISQVLQEQASSSSEKRELQEKIKHIEKESAFLVEKENSSKEMIAELNNEIDRLRMQVVESEGAKNSISQENEQLIEKISTLHSQVQDLETRLASAQSSLDAQKDASEKEDLNAEIEAACALVEKLVTENADLVEKMNELYMELGSRNMESNVASILIPAHATIQVPIPTSNKAVSSSTTNTPRHFETVLIAEEQRYDVDTDNANHMARHLSKTTVSKEIVQIPLDENELENHDLEAQPSSANEGGQGLREEEEDVGLTESPLIGAPFRLISFVAKYVSGADLVD